MAGLRLKSGLAVRAKPWLVAQPWFGRGSVMVRPRRSNISVISQPCLSCVSAMFRPWIGDGAAMASAQVLERSATQPTQDPGSGRVKDKSLPSDSCTVVLQESDVFSSWTIRQSSVEFLDGRSSVEFSRRPSDSDRARYSWLDEDEWSAEASWGSDDKYILLCLSDFELVESVEDSAEKRH